MKESCLFAIIVMLFLQPAIAFSAEVQKGIIKSVDPKTGLVVFTSTDHQDETLSVDKSVELDTIKAGDKVEITVENNMLKSIKQDHVNWCPKGY